MLRPSTFSRRDWRIALLLAMGYSCTKACRRLKCHRKDVRRVARDLREQYGVSLAELRQRMAPIPAASFERMLATLLEAYRKGDTLAVWGQNVRLEGQVAVRTPMSGPPWALDPVDYVFEPLGRIDWKREWDHYNRALGGCFTIDLGDNADPMARVHMTAPECAILLDKRRPPRPQLVAEFRRVAAFLLEAADWFASFQPSDFEESETRTLRTYLRGKLVWSEGVKTAL